MNSLLWHDCLLQWDHQSVAAGHAPTPLSKQASKQARDREKERRNRVVMRLHAMDYEDLRSRFRRTTPIMIITIIVVVNPPLHRHSTRVHEYAQER